MTEGKAWDTEEAIRALGYIQQRDDDVRICYDESCFSLSRDVIGQRPVLAADANGVYRVESGWVELRRT